MVEESIVNSITDPLTSNTGDEPSSPNAVYTQVHGHQAFILGLNYIFSFSFSFY